MYNDDSFIKGNEIFTTIKNKYKEVIDRFKSNINKDKYNNYNNENEYSYKESNKTFNNKNNKDKNSKYKKHNNINNNILDNTIIIDSSINGIELLIDNNINTPIKREKLMSSKSDKINKNKINKSNRNKNNINNKSNISININKSINKSKINNKSNKNKNKNNISINKNNRNINKINNNRNINKSNISININKSNINHSNISINIDNIKDIKNRINIKINNILSIKDIKSIINIEIKELKEIKKINEASYSDIYYKDESIYKVMEINDVFYKELFILKTLNENKNNVTVKLYDYFLCYGNDFIQPFMEYSNNIEYDKVSMVNNKASYNPIPIKDKLYGVIQMENGGIEAEKYKFKNKKEILGFLKELINKIETMESTWQMEHRDLHLGNILIKNDYKNNIDNDNLTNFKLNIIDFSLSRLKINNLLIYNNLNSDKEIFLGENDRQYDIYREMKVITKGIWNNYYPKTNILWYSYIIDKITENCYECRIIKQIKDKINDVSSAKELRYFIETILS